MKQYSLKAIIQLKKGLLKTQGSFVDEVDTNEGIEEWLLNDDYLHIGNFAFMIDLFKNERNT